MMRDRDPAADARQRLVRRATYYTFAFAGAGLAVAIGGAALVAWLLTSRGQPFVRTWIILTLIVVLPGLIATIWKTVRGK